MAMLIFLTSTTANWHAKKQHAHQAKAAHRATEHLHGAYQAAAERPMDLLHQRGARLAPAWQRHHTTAVRQTLPELVDQILAEPGWPALAATLDEARTVSHNPTTLLTQAAAPGELNSAEHMGDVLVWRLRRMAVLPADPQNSWSRRVGSTHSVPSPEQAARIGTRHANNPLRRR